MNYLAHFYLSGRSGDLLIGNFIADGVKGSRYRDYPPGIREGILMHRAIDDFTDRHPVTIRSRARLRDRFHHYSGVITDVFYDHFLASRWADYSQESLPDFAARIYAFLGSKSETFPDKPRYMLPFMKQHNWLVAYADIEGIRRVMTGMARRTKFESGMEFSADALRESYADFRQDFLDFFPEVLKFTEPYRLRAQS